LQGSLCLKPKLIVGVLHKHIIANSTARCSQLMFVMKINKNIKQQVAVDSDSSIYNKHNHQRTINTHTRAKLRCTFSTEKLLVRNIHKLK